MDRYEKTGFPALIFWEHLKGGKVRKAKPLIPWEKKEDPAETPVVPKGENANKESQKEDSPREFQ